MTLNKLRIITTLVLMLCNITIYAQKDLEKLISDTLTIIANKQASVGKVNISSIAINIEEKSISVFANERLSEIPIRLTTVDRIYKMISNVMGSKYAGYKVNCMTANIEISFLIPNFFRTESYDNQRLKKSDFTITPLITNTSRPYIASSGLQNKHIALWQSHGWYYNQKSGKWMWQRARLFQTVEDLFTQSFVLPYLVPMLENAGANVLLPRERDTQINEIIVDNDINNALGRYSEHNDRKSWKTGEAGFANLQKVYKQGENPFKMGTYRFVSSITEDDELTYAEWTPNIPDNGFYAVYVSYKSEEKSVTDARYTVYHKGGKTEFSVNQKINGGTWLYLGTFKFEKGKNRQYKVVLSNLSKTSNRIITADAVKFGGGLGNIARSPNEAGITQNVKSSDSIGLANAVILPVEVKEPITSNYPRYTESARYWLQWAGMPDSIYSRNEGKNDYTDDYQSRGLWVNYLAGGSSVLPSKVGLGVPIDFSLAFHTDAGTTFNDSIIGILGICSVSNSAGNTVFANGMSRWASRDLTDIIQTQITEDIRKVFAPEFTRRGLWNKSYSESRTPEVPAMLLELLSHQNFADMRYGLDPRFKFLVSRAIYKGMLKFSSSLSGSPYIVQPLPVREFSSRFIAKNRVELRWQPTNDSIEPSAKSEHYIVYTRIDEGGFNNGIVTNNNKIVMEIQPGKIYSFKISALNDGGESFPSEILSVCRMQHERGNVLIVNGFDRISAPGSFVQNHTSGGFKNDDDPGVPYLNDYSFIGKQFEFDRSKPWVTDDNQGFGASYSNYETQVIAGNTFDYPYLHGKSIKLAGFSFVSCSKESVLNKAISLKDYPIVDLILGKQKQTFIGNAKKDMEFKTFPLALQQSLLTYCDQGGKLLVSGAYIASDFYNSNYIKIEEKLFLENTLMIKLNSGIENLSSKVKMVNSPFSEFNRGEFSFYDLPNKYSYYLESANAIEPSGLGAFTICRYNGTNLSAGVAYKGKYKLCALGFPFEVIQSEKERNKLMESVLSFFGSER